MSRRARAVSVTAAAIVWGLSTHAQAFCLTHTCDARKEQCEFDQAHCNVGGLPLFWASSIVTWDVQKDGSAKEKISAETLDAVVESAFARWEAADCGNGQRPSIRLVDMGPIDCGKPEYNSTQPNANVITFHDAPWPYADAGAQTNTLALTTVFFNPTTGEIYDANVEINSAQQNFVLRGNDIGGDDLNAVLTHELGHFLGLSHSEDHPNATMYTMYDAGMVTLEADDIAGICTSLPPGRLTQDSSEPRHGFSGECAAPEKGCCASTIGAHAPRTQVLGLWAFGLGVFGWFGRTRLRRRAGSGRALRR